MQEIIHPKGKIYYTMGEVAEMFDVKPSLLRFWEQEFDTIRPHRNKKGNRLYRPQDVDNIKVIYHLVKERKMKLEVARKYIKDNKDGAERDAEIVERLMSIRSMLQEIKDDLAYDGVVVDDDAEMQAKEIETSLEEPYYSYASPEESALDGEEEFVHEIEIKPPFEEQPLFEITPEPVYNTVDDAMEAFITKHYDESGDEDRPAVDPFAFMNTENPDGEANGEKKPERPVIIEQTLF